MKRSPFSDPRYAAVIGWLAGKGLLYAPGVPVRKSGRLAIADVLWIGEHAEPRVLEVLPAALLHFPATFSGPLPPDLEQLLAALRREAPEWLAFRGIPYEKIRLWADRPLPDRRVKPLSRRKSMKSFRLAPDVVRTIRAAAAARSISEAEYLEQLVRGLSKPAGGPPITLPLN